MQITKATLKELTYEVNGAAIEVHKTIGPGLLESIYHDCLRHELSLRGIRFVSEQVIPLNYKELELVADLRCDLFVEQAIVLELKAVKELLPIHEAQLLTYMKLLESPKGVLYNFKTAQLMTSGMKTFVNHHFGELANS